MNTAAQWYAAQARIAELEKALLLAAYELDVENTYAESTTAQTIRAALNKETA